MIFLSFRKDYEFSFVRMMETQKVSNSSEKNNLSRPVNMLTSSESVATLSIFVYNFKLLTVLQRKHCLCPIFLYRCFKKNLILKETIDWLIDWFMAAGGPRLQSGWGQRIFTYPSFWALVRSANFLPEPRNQNLFPDPGILAISWPVLICDFFLIIYLQ